VSCPDWNALAAHRLERDGAEPTGWPAALEHFDSCRLCRRQALAADPTLVFRRLPAAESAPASVDVDVAAMCQAVAALRGASRLEASERRGGSWKRWAAAAALAIAALSMPGDVGRAGRARPAPDQAAIFRSGAAFASSSLGDAADVPLIDGVSEPGARVYHMDGEGMSVVMVIDESLDESLDI
jgi:hypothetical protein